MLLTQTDKSYTSSDNLFRLLIEPTGFCNAKCPHCPRYTDDGFLHDYIPETHLTIDALKNGLDPRKLQRLGRVEFAGATGDPAMSPHIEDTMHPVCNKACSKIIKGTSTKVAGHRESVIKIIKNKNESE